MKTLALFAIVWISGFHGAVASEPPSPLILGENPVSVVDLVPHAEFLVDPSGRLDITQILSAPWSREFQLPSASPPSFGFTRAAAWMRCEIRSASPHAEPLVVAQRNARIARVEWFVVANGRVEKSLVGGSAIPSAVPARHSAIGFEVPAGESRTVYARVTSDTALLLPFVAGSPEAMRRAESRQSAFDLFLIGFCTAAALFIAMLGLTLRQPMFFYLAAFAAVYSGYYAIFHGYLAEFWPGRPFWIERAGFACVSALGIFSFIRFNGAYLDIRTMARHERILQRTAESLLLLGAGFALILDFLNAMRLLSLLMAAGALLATLVIVLRARHHRQREEIWFFLAWFVYGACLTLISTKLIGALPVSVPFETLQRFLVPAIIAAFFLVASARQRSLQRLEIQLAETEALRSRAEWERDAKSLFLANVSHEIRTPLSALVGLSQAMWLRCESSAPHAEFTQFLNRVRSGGHYLGLLLRNVLNVSAAESGRAPVRLHQFYLADWIDEVRNILEPLAEYHGGRLEWVSPPSDEVRLRTDEMRLTQILLNLAENALKFGTASGEPVTIRFEITAIGLRMTVDDCGPGIPADRLDSVFEEFEQVGGQSRPMATGVGLGLAVVKLNTALLGGTLAVEPRPAGGMRFTVEIPNDPEKKSTESPDAPASELPAPPNL
jgi:signal transduction histidine kinase